PAATSPTPAATPQPADSTAPKQAAVETASHTQPVNDPPKQLPTSPSTDSGAVKTKMNADGVRNEDYLIGEGDVLQIAVYGEPTASVQSATVRPDGKISMPLIKEVLVAGVTPAQVEATIQEQLGKIIRAPDVTVVVAQINSKKIFLTGAVKREGPL